MSEGAMSDFERWKCWKCH